MKEDLSSFLPLSPAALHILLALASESRHGYGIILEVVHQSEGHYKLGPGTLYDNLEKLMSESLVEEVSRPKNDNDRRSRYYGLSDLGRRVLSAEISRLQGLIRKVRPHLRPWTGVRTS
jgi:DNA-binding PadR family transcriptional regulator